MKLSLKDKIEIVRLHDEEYFGYETIAKKYNVNFSAIQNIINCYKKHGFNSLKHPHKQHIYSADFKMMLINLVYEGR